MIEYLYRIVQSFFRDVIQYLAAEFGGDVFCHRQVHVKIISAVHGAGTGNFAFERRDEFKHFLHQRYDVLRLIVTGEQQIKSGAAAHRAEIENLVLPGNMVSKEGRAKMLDGMYFRGVHHRLIIRARDADVKGRDGRVAGKIFAGHVDAGYQSDVIHGKAGNFFHDDITSFLNKNGWRSP